VAKNIPQNDRQKPSNIADFQQETLLLAMASLSRVYDGNY
jgi:hypothetical protein